MSRKQVKMEATEQEEQTKSQLVQIRIPSDLRKRPYGLCASAGIPTAGMSPRDAWAEWNEYRKQEREAKKAGKKSKRERQSHAPALRISAGQIIALPLKKEEPTRLAPVIDVPVRSERIIENMEAHQAAKNSSVKIPELNAENIQMANSNSMFNRGSVIEKDYKLYVERILSWDISDSKKEKLIETLHNKFEEKLYADSRFVPWTVSGPAKYPAQTMQKRGERSMKKSSEIVEWFERVEESVKNSQKQYQDDTAKRARYEEAYIRRFANGEIYKEPSSLLIAGVLPRLAVYDPKRYAELYEELDKKFHFRGNTNAAKIYKQIKEGTFQGERKPAQKLHETENLNTYKKKINAGERVFMKFTTRPKPQLVYALKKRGWHWNALEQAWSVPVGKYDEEFVKGIDERYSKYL